MLAKINSVTCAFSLLVLVLVLSGCTPTGPRALLDGRDQLDKGNYPAAVASLKTATSLLRTNADAWNYYGVALQCNGQPDDAANAYKQALEYNRDLMEAHFNLGCLWLEQNKPADAKTEFSACTLRRPNEPAAWLKLGSAQLRLGEYVAAEKSFSTVLYLKPADAEAYNGLGMARIQRNKPKDAAQFFAAALQSNPQLASARLNLATVNQQYLRDNKAALENYRAYLALLPRPANWDEVNAIASALEQSLAPATIPATQPRPTVASATPFAEPKPQPKPNVPTTTPAPANTVARTPAAPRPATESATTPAAETRHLVPMTRPATPVNPPQPQVVAVAAAPTIVTTPTPAPTTVAPSRASANDNPIVTTNLDLASTDEAAPTDSEKKTGLWQRMFGGSHKTITTAQPSLETKLTPLPPEETPAPTRPARPPAPLTFQRYDYTSPRKPATGNHVAASGAFTRAQVFEQDEKWTEALQWYQQAAEFDPAWYEAQYNTGVLAHRLRNYSVALPRYENALAIQPDSADARYNLALALKAAGYPVDAANEFKKLLAAHPTEVRAALALASLSAQTLHDNAQARVYYQKVLELAPDHPQANDIRFWISSNPP